MTLTDNQNALFRASMEGLVEPAPSWTPYRVHKDASDDDFVTQRWAAFAKLDDIRWGYITQPGWGRGLFSPAKTRDVKTFIDTGEGAITPEVSAVREETETLRNTVRELARRQAGGLSLEALNNVLAVYSDLNRFMLEYDALDLRLAIAPGTPASVGQALTLLTDIVAWARDVQLLEPDGQTTSLPLIFGPARDAVSAASVGQLEWFLRTATKITFPHVSTLVARNRLIGPAAKYAEDKASLLDLAPKALHPHLKRTALGTHSGGWLDGPRDYNTIGGWWAAAEEVIALADQPPAQLAASFDARQHNQSDDPRQMPLRGLASWTFDRAAGRWYNDIVWQTLIVMAAMRLEALSPRAANGTTKKPWLDRTLDHLKTTYDYKMLKGFGFELIKEYDRPMLVTSAPEMEALGAERLRPGIPTYKVFVDGKSPTFISPA